MDLGEVVGTEALAPEDYCRQVEAYLCRKNEGHLIRIVGPAFEMVCGWAARGVPLKVAFRGVDRTVERYYVKGPRRRPVRIDFCEADVLDVFDEWRRAVGIGLAGSGPDEEPHDGNRRHGTLPSHLERVIARLTALRGGADPTLDAVIGDIVRELDAARATAKGLRGSAREQLLVRLVELDGRLLEAARAVLGNAGLGQLRGEAAAELAPFRARMPAEAYEGSLAACTDRLLRERLRLPAIAFEG